MQCVTPLVNAMTVACDLRRSGASTPHHVGRTCNLLGPRHAIGRRV